MPSVFVGFRIEVVGDDSDEPEPVALGEEERASN